MKNNRLRILKDIHNNFYVGLTFYGSYDIGYWKQSTKKYKTLNRLIKYNPQYYQVKQDIQEV